MPHRLTWEEREIRELWGMQRKAQGLLQPVYLGWLKNIGAALEPEPANDELLDALRSPVLQLLKGISTRSVAETWALLTRTAPVVLLVFERLGKMTQGIRKVSQDEWDSLVDAFLNEALALPSGISSEADFFKVSVHQWKSAMRGSGIGSAHVAERALNLLALDALLLDTRLRRFWSAANFVEADDGGYVVKVLVWALFHHGEKRDLQREKEIQNSLASVLMQVPNSKLFPELHGESEAARQKVQANPRLRAARDGQVPIPALTREENHLLLKAMAGNRPDLPSGEGYVDVMRGLWRRSFGSKYNG